MDAAATLGAVVGGFVGGLIGSWRSLHKVAKEAAERAVVEHEAACSARRDRSPGYPPDLTPTDPWPLPTDP